MNRAFEKELSRACLLYTSDEPTKAIDAITQYEILNELLHIKENHNTAMILSLIHI